MTPGARIQAAAELLDAIAADCARPADLLVRRWFRRRRYAGSSDRAAINDLVYGVLRRLGALQWRLRQAGLPENGRGLVLAELHRRALPPDEINALFSGQGHAPAPLNAAEAAYLGGMRDSGDVPPWVDAALPEWCLPLLQGRYGAAWRDEAAAMLTGAPTDLRVNTLKRTRDSVLAWLAAQGMEAAPCRYAPAGIRLSGRVAAGRLAPLLKGDAEIQDEGSQLAAIACAARPGERAIDYCAGGGGKTLALAAAMKGEGEILACDIAPQRLAALRRRAEKACADMVRIHDLRQGPPRGDGDLVVVDAPCSGSGTWRRSPWAKWRMDAAELDRLCRLQAEILDAAAALLPAGGRLAYITCSLFACENDEQADAFLARHPGFRPLDISMGIAVPQAPVAERGRMQLTPACSGTDGFFVALFKREGG